MADWFGVDVKSVRTRCTATIAKPGRRAGDVRCEQLTRHPSGRCVYHLTSEERALEVGKWANPSGLCICGCGGETKIATYHCPSRGVFLGQPLRYIRGHHLRKSGVEYIVDANGCWIWQLAVSKNGYGSYSNGSVHRYAHREMYERHCGPIPEGLNLDHLCRVRRCVNPGHLEPVTQAENVRRGFAARRAQ